MQTIEQIISSKEKLIQTLRTYDADGSDVVKLDRFHRILERDHIDTKDKMFQTVLHLYRINTDRKDKDSIDYIAFFKFLQKNKRIIEMLKEEQEETKDESTINSTNPHLMSTKKEPEIKSNFNPSKKERTKFFYYSLRKLIRLIIWNNFKEKLKMNKSTSRFYSRKLVQSSNCLGPSRRLSATMGQPDSSKSNSNRGSSQKNLGRLSSKSLSLDQKRNYTSTDNSAIHPLGPNISANTTLNRTSRENPVKSFFSATENSRIFDNTLKKHQRDRSKEPNDSFQTFYIDELCNSKLEKGDTSAIHQRVNNTEVDIENTFTDLIENIKLDTTFQELSFKSNNKSAIKDMKLRHPNDSSLNMTSEYRSKSPDRSNKNQKELDLSLVKLYAEKILTTKLESKIEDLQKENVSLLLERNSQEMRFQQHLSALSFYKYQNFSMSLNLSFKMIIKRLKGSFFSNYRSILHDYSRNDIPNKAKKRVALRGLLINFKRNMQTVIRYWRNYSVKDSRPEIQDASNLFEYSTKSLLSPTGLMPPTSRRIFSSKKVQGFLYKEQTAINANLFSRIIGSIFLKKLNLSMNAIKLSALQVTPVLTSRLKAKYLAQILAKRILLNIRYAHSKLELNNQLNLQSLITNQKMKELKKRMLETSEKYQNSKIINVFLGACRRKLASAVMFWKKNVDALRENKELLRSSFNSKKNEKYKQISVSCKMLNKSYDEFCRRQSNDIDLTASVNSQKSPYIVKDFTPNATINTKDFTSPFEPRPILGDILSKSSNINSKGLTSSLEFILSRTNKENNQIDSREKNEMKTPPLANFRGFSNNVSAIGEVSPIRTPERNSLFDTSPISNLKSIIKESEKIKDIRTSSTVNLNRVFDKDLPVFAWDREKAEELTLRGSVDKKSITSAIEFLKNL